MILPDSVFWVAIFLSALIFSILAFDVPSSGTLITSTTDQEDKADIEGLYALGRVLSKMRLIFFSGLAAGFWFVLGILTFTANNCDFTFNACYTSPTFTNATATITTFSWSAPGGLLFTFLGLAYVIWTIIAGFSMWALHLRAIGKAKTR